MNLDALEERLKAAVDAGTSLSLLASELDLPALPDFLWPSSALELADIAYQRISAAELVIKGSAKLPVIGVINLALIAQPGEDPPVRTELALQQALDMTALLRTVLPWLDSIDDLLEQIKATAIQWEMPKLKALDIRLDLNGAYETRLAGLKLRLALDKGRIRFDSDASDVDLTGRLTIGDLETELLVRVENGKASISAKLDDLNLRSLAGMIGLAIPAIPGLDLVDDALDGMELMFRDGVPLLVFSYDTAIGPARCLVVNEAGAWSLVAGLHARSFRFADLDGALAPLDAVARVIAFGDPVISFADRNIASMRYPFPDGWSAASFQKGVKINGQLLLEDYGLDIFAKLFGLKRLPLSIPIGTDWSQLRIAASLDKEITFLGDTAIIRNLSVGIQPDPFQTSLAGEVAISLFGTELPIFLLGGAITAQTMKLFLTSKGVWKEPLGLPVTVEELTFQISTVPAYGLFGKIALSDRPIEMAMEFIGEVPTFFAGRVDGELPLGSVLLDLIKVDLLPSFFQPSIKDFHLYIVLNPAGASVGTHIYPFGLSIGGTLAILGLGITAEILISKTQIRAIGELDGPIIVDPIFRLAGVEKAAPTIKIDTAGDPIVSMDAQLRVLGLQQSVRAVLGSEGFSARLEEALGAAKAKLTVTIGDGHVQADGDIVCQITGSVGPIRLVSGGPDLGTIRIDTGAEMRSNARIAFNGGLDMRVQGRITIVGMSISLPSFSVNIQSIEELPAAVFAYIRDNIVELLADLFSDVGRWLRAIADSLIEGVEDVARTLKEHFQQASREIADAMLNTLRDTLDRTAQALKGIGETAERIGRIFHDLGRGDGEIAGALKVAGFAPEVIGNVLRELGNAPDAVGQILKDAGFPDAVVDVALRAIFPGIPEIGWPPHIKHVKLPHIKHVKLPHVKHVKLPHVKHIKAPHIKHIKIF